MESARRWFAGGNPPDIDQWRDEDNLDALRKLFLASKGHGDFSTKKYDQDGKEAVEKVGVGLANTSFNADEVLDARSSAMGTASDTIEFVERMADAGVDECYFVVQMGGVPHDVVMESIRQIGTKVIPHFRKPQPKVFLAS